MPLSGSSTLHGVNPNLKKRERERETERETERDRSSLQQKCQKNGPQKYLI